MPEEVTLLTPSALSYVGVLAARSCPPGFAKNEEGQASEGSSDYYSQGQELLMCVC